jgi:hypothetical protein
VAAASCFTALLALCAGILLPGAMAQPQLQEHKARFQRASDPVEKAKLMRKLGEAQLDLLRNHARSGHVDAALEVLNDYCDAVALAHNGLKASGINAEKKPSGFKHLEIHVRQGLRRLEDVIIAIPVEQREPFEAIRKRLEEIDRELIEMLFPRRPDKRKG